MRIVVRFYLFPHKFIYCKQKKQMTLITFLQLTIFTAYVLFIYNRYGVLTSISTSTYRLEGNERWYFMLFLWSIGLLNLFQGMGGYGVFASASFIFTGMTIDFREKLTKEVHNIATAGTIIFTYIGLWVLYGIWFPSVLLPIAMLFIYKRKDFIWWLEIIAMILGIAGYIAR